MREVRTETQDRKVEGKNHGRTLFFGSSQGYLPSVILPTAGWVLLHLPAFKTVHTDMPIGQSDLDSFLI